MGKDMEILRGGMPGQAQDAADAARYSRANYGTGMRQDVSPASEDVERDEFGYAVYRAPEGSPEQGAHARVDGVDPSMRGRNGGHGNNRSHSSHSHHHHHHHHHGKRRARRIAIAVVVVVALLVAACGVAGFTLYQSAQAVRADASTVTSSLSKLGGQITGGDVAAAQQTAQSIQDASDAMCEETQGTLWQIGSLVPVVGTDISNVRALSSALHNLSSDAITPLVDAAASQGGISLTGTEGDIDCTSLVSLVDAAAQVNPAVQQAASQVEALQPGVIDQVNSALEKAQESLGTVAALTSAAETLAPNLSSMLGMDGETKVYLVAGETNSEIRACGGFPGQECLITAEDGHLYMGDFEAATDVGYLPDDEWLPITAEEEALFSEVVSFNPYDMNMNPDFPRAASMAAEAYYINRDVQVDGVVMFDAVVMQRLIGVCGAITTSDGVVVDGTNAAQLILNQAYIDYTSSQQDAFFEEVANAMMDEFSSSLGSSKMSALLDVIEASIADHRLLAWVRDDDVQQAIEETGLSGALVDDEEAPQLGVYFNNVTYGKIDWYLDADTQVVSSTKNADGSTTYHVVTTMTNLTSDAEIDEISEGPGGAYIEGGSAAKRSSSDMVTRVLLYAPYGGSISNVTRTSSLGSSALFYENDASLTYNGFNVEYAEMHITGGETVTIAYDVTTSPNAQEELDIRVTPTGRNVEG